MTIRKSGLWLCTVTLLVTSPAAASEPLTARVSPPVSAPAPRDIVVRALIEPDVRNRSVEFVLESTAFYASSTMQLDSDRAPRLKEARFRELPAGRYEIRVTLMGADGERANIVRRISLW
jgi:hypothetical protein